MSEIVKVDAFEPSSYGEVRIMAKDISLSGLCRFKTMEQVALVMMTAKDLGIPKSTALRQMWISPDGSPRMDADLIVGLCLRDRDCEYFYCAETTRDHATYVTKRRSNPKETPHTFTIQDARDAGLIKEDKKDSSWVKWLRAMLRHRCSAELARMVYPDKVGGLYSLEEFDGAEVSVRTVKPIVAAPVVTAAGNVQTDHAPAEAWVPATQEVIDTPEAEDWPALIAALKSVKEVKALADRMPKDKELTAVLTARYNELKKGAA